MHSKNGSLEPQQVPGQRVREGGGGCRVWDREGEGDLGCVLSVLETTGFFQNLWVMGVLLSGVSTEEGASSIEVPSSPSFPCGWSGGEGESQRQGQP